MLTLKKIAITGGIASGKTTVCRVFQELGACVVYADDIAHELLTPSTEVGQRVIKVFGQTILKQGKIDRRALAELAFQNSESLNQLEKILHPAIVRRIEELYREARKTGTYTSFVVEIPLLYEIKQESFYDKVIAVLADEELCRKRFTESGFSSDDYDRRMRRHLSPKQKSAKADFVIHNNKTLDHLRKEVVHINQSIQTESHGSRTSN